MIHKYLARDGENVNGAAGLDSTSWEGAGTFVIHDDDALGGDSAFGDLERGGDSAIGEEPFTRTKGHRKYFQP